MQVYGARSLRKAPDRTHEKTTGGTLVACRARSLRAQKLGCVAFESASPHGFCGAPVSPGRKSQLTRRSAVRKGAPPTIPAKSLNLVIRP
jgi:hypothetical protein